MYMWVCVHMCTWLSAAGPTWGVIFEGSRLKTRTSLLPRFGEKGRSSFELWACSSIRGCQPRWDGLYMYVHICICMRVGMYVYIHICKCVYMYICRCVGVCMCVYIYMRRYACACIYIYMRKVYVNICVKYIYACVCVYICMHMYG